MASAFGWMGRGGIGKAALCLAAWLLSPCPTPAQGLAAAGTAAAAGDATYAGELAGGQPTVLTLFADRSFRMRMRVDGTAEVYDLGRWSRDAAGIVELRGGREAPMRFDATTPSLLRPLGTTGSRDAAAGPQALHRQPEVDRLDGPMRLRGMYFYMADAASLTECLTGRRWPVSVEGGHLALERAYLEHRARGGGEWVLAVFSGRFAMRAPEPGTSPREVIVVESFDRLWPRESCAAEAPGSASLLGTRWRVVEIDGRPPQLDPGRREPWLQLSGEGNRVSGETGCNRLSGGFEQGSDGLRFKNLATTRMACAGAGAAQEHSLLDALRATASQRIVGEALQLRDAQGRVRLRCEALYLR